MKKIILILLVLTILCGCTAQVNVDVLDNGTVSEKLIISQNKSNFSDNINIDEVVNNYLEIYKDMLTGYKYEDISNDKDIKFKIEKKYSNICAYFKESVFVEKNTKGLNCDVVNNTYEINAWINTFDCDDGCLESPLVEEVIFNITSSAKIDNNNATNVLNNKYIWIFNDMSPNNINFVIAKTNNALEKKPYSGTIILFFVITCIFSIIFFILYGKYKKNQIKF